MPSTESRVRGAFLFWLLGGAVGVFRCVPSNRLRGRRRSGSLSSAHRQPWLARGICQSIRLALVLAGGLEARSALSSAKGLWRCDPRRPR
ncbi:Hypothetical predicted protein [Marmota monax]|uniref:Uncharacterized protein n=1 Tax=Marmota monax TaxID=9995 RepID=A0A5E4ACQ8_MARMO|nr:Hypothetical predicted protein [Marmota monax]